MFRCAFLPTIIQTSAPHLHSHPLSLITLTTPHSYANQRQSVACTAGRFVADACSPVEQHLLHTAVGAVQRSLVIEVDHFQLRTMHEKLTYHRRCTVRQLRESTGRIELTAAPQLPHAHTPKRWLEHETHCSPIPSTLSAGSPS